MKASTKTLIRLTALAITMIPYRWKREGGTTVCQSLLFRYEYNKMNKPSLTLQKNR